MFAPPAVSAAAAAPDYSKDFAWLCLPGPRRHLLDAAADDRAQPQRLWLDAA